MFLYQILFISNFDVYHAAFIYICSCCVNQVSWHRAHIWNCICYFDLSVHSDLKLLYWNTTVAWLTHAICSLLQGIRCVRVDSQRFKAASANASSCRRMLPSPGVLIMSREPCGLKLRKSTCKPALLPAARLAARDVSHERDSRARQAPRRLVRLSITNAPY